MSEYVSKQAVNDCIRSWYEHMGVDLHGVWNKQLAEIVLGKDADDLALDFRELRMKIDTIPTAEFKSEKELVRCKECKHQSFYLNDDESFHCDKTGVVNMHTYEGDGEFFCPYGERREDAHTESTD